jgi:hypothetical protein
MANSNPTPLGNLNTVNRSLCAAIQVMGDLVLAIPEQLDDSLAAGDLREVGRRLVASGGDLTELGVKMGVRADELERAEQS